MQSVTEAQRLARAEDFDYLHRISDGYTQIRRYAPAFLNAFRFKAAPAAQAILEAVETLKVMNANNLRKVPADAPTGFVRKRWETLVFSDAGIDRRFYELCALAELKNALRSGDIWVQGSRQFKDFDEYLIPSERFNALLEANRLSLVVATDCKAYLQGRLSRLEQQLETVDRIAQSGELPDAVITASGLKITPLVSAVPEEADQIMRRRPTPCCRTSRSPSCCSKSTIGLGLHGTLHTLKARKCQKIASCYSRRFWRTPSILG